MEEKTKDYENAYKIISDLRVGVEKDKDVLSKQIEDMLLDFNIKHEGLAAIDNVIIKSEWDAISDEGVGVIRTSHSLKVNIETLFLDEIQRKIESLA